eukprot:gene33976-43891_t
MAIRRRAAATFIEAETITNCLATVFTAEIMNKSDQLLKAARAGRVDEMSALLDQGADLQCTDENGQTASDLAFTKPIRCRLLYSQEAKAIFLQLSSNNSVAIPYAILKDWTGNFDNAPACDGPHGMIGKGAFGEVFKGLAVIPKEPAIDLAVKRMDISKLQLDGGAGGGGRFSEALCASYRREIHVLSRFRHPNIVRLIGFSEP